MKSWFLVTIFSILFSLSPGINISIASSVVFSDGFENGFSEWTGNDLQWTTSGTNSSTPDGVHGGSKRGQVRGDSAIKPPIDAVLLKSISTVGYENVTIDFWYRIKDSLEADDHVFIEWTNDDITWTSLHDFTGVATGWEYISFSLPVDADDKANFGIRFRANLGSGSDIFYLDDVVLSGDNNNPTTTPELTPTPDAGPSPSETPLPSITPTPAPPTPIPPTPTPATPTPVPTVSKTPTPPVSKTPTPTPSIAQTPTPLLTKTPMPSPTPVVKKSASPMPKPSVELVASESIEVMELAEESEKISEDTNNLSASISSFVSSKSFWLLGMMVFAVVFSLAKFKKD